MLRWSVGLTLKDRLRNKEVWARMAVRELAGTIRGISLHWFGHLMQRGESYVRKKVERIVVGQSRRGRTRWR